jgi:succinoglycan biosynthesis transport protein ExoP
MRITSEAENPIVAAQVANVLAELLVAENRKAQTRGAYNISLVDPATVPSSPSSPRTEINIAMGIIVGLIGGLGLAFLFENLDTKLYTTEQIEAIMPWSTLGYIPKAQKKQTKIMNGNSPEGEAFRRLRTSLLVSNHEVPFRVLLVTSAEPGEGKSTIVANLAYTIAQLGLSVVIVDGDLRLPTLHKIFNISNEFGLSNLLQQKITLTKAIQATCTPQVHVLTSGPRPHNPVEMLSSDHMAAIIKELRQQFDLVLIDTPAVLAVTDALVLAPFVDGIIFVVGRAQAKLETVQSAQQQLDGINATPIGIVINRTSRDKNYY